MFDLIKLILGMPTCRGCRYRRFWGLLCGYKKKDSIFPISNWSRNDLWCWHYVDAQPKVK